MSHSLLIAVLCACTLSAQPNPGTGSIEGHVLNSHTSSPIRRATVTLTAPLVPVRLVAETDSEGRFQFTSLPPGTYRLSARRAGFLDRPARRPIPLGPNDKVTNAEIRLAPQGVIAGHVVDEEGEPVDGAWVSMFKQIYRDGRKLWDRLAASQTNDRGEYRFPNLSPGRYLLQARDDRPPIDNRYGSPPNTFYVPAYYPNAAGQQQAVPVEVGAGAEVGGIDIRLFKVVRPPAVRIRGKVTGVPPDSQISVLLEADEGFFGSGASTVVTAPDYAFDLSAPPGHYTISGSEYSGTSEAYGSVRVTVTGDVTGIVLPMSPAPVISARIRVAEGAVKLNLEGVKVVLTRLSSPVSEIFELRSDAAGRFGSSKPLRPGHYSVVLRSVPEDCFVREIRLGEQEVSPNVFEIVAPGQLEIVLSNTAGKIAGSVADPDGKPFPGSIVTLISADGRSWPSKQAADDAGHFHFTGLRPSKYSLFAWEEVADDLWQDPEFCKKHEDRAIEITVAPGETQNAQLRVIAAEEMK